MIIHLIRTTDLDQQLFQSVVEILQSAGGPMNFIDTEYVGEFKENELISEKPDPKEIAVMHFDLMPSHISKSLPLKHDITSWDNLFRRCKEYKKIIGPVLFPCGKPVFIV